MGFVGCYDWRWESWVDVRIGIKVGEWFEVREWVREGGGGYEVMNINDKRIAQMSDGIGGGSERCGSKDFYSTLFTCHYTHNTDIFYIL